MERSRRILAVCTLAVLASSHVLACNLTLLSAKRLLPKYFGSVLRSDPTYTDRAFRDLIHQESIDPESFAGSLDGIEFYDRADPNYRRRLIDLGVGLQGLDAVEACSHGLCITIGSIEVGGVRHPNYSIIGIDTVGRSKKAIARTLAEELAHAKYNKVVEDLFAGKESVIAKNPKAMALLNEFQAKYRAARDIKGALRSNTDILAEMHQLYTEYVDGQDSFHQVIWYAREKTGKTIDELTLNDVLGAALSLDRKADNAITYDQRQQSIAFRRALRENLGRYDYVKDPWAPR